MRAAAQEREVAPQDLYPSRVGGAPRLLPRRDPVVYGSRPLQLNDRQWSSYQRDGFLVVPDFLAPPHVRHLEQEIQRLRAEHAEDQRPEVIREPNGREVRSIFAVHKMSAAIAELVCTPQLLSIVEAILGGPVSVHQSRVNYKPGLSGKEFYWHSDFETWHVEDGMPRMRALSCSINLTPNTPHNGPLMVVPGSHLHFASCPGYTPENHHLQSLRRQELGVPAPEQLHALMEAGGIESIVSGPGSLLLFDCNTLHGSNSNISPYPRSNIFLVFNSVYNSIGKPFGSRKPRPEFLASRDASDVAGTTDPGPS